MQTIPAFARAAVDRLVAAYEEGRASAPPTVASRVCQLVESSEKEQRYPFMSALFGKTAEGMSKSNRTVTVANNQVSCGYEIPLDDIVSGNLVGNEYCLKTWGEQVARWPDRFLWELMKANPVGWDGVPLFSPEHPANPDAPGKGAWSNVADRSLSDWGIVAAEMANRVGPDGHPLGVKATTALVPESMTDDARGQLPEGVDLLVSADLYRDDPRTWYAIATPEQGTRPFILQVRSPLELVTRQQDWMLYLDARARGAVAAGLPHLITRCRAR